MTEFKLLDDLADRPPGIPFPAPFDPDYAANVLTDMDTDDPSLDRLQAFSKDPVGHALLVAVVGNSPYLAQIMLKDLKFLQDVSLAGLQASLDVVLNTIKSDQAAAQPEVARMASLRIARRRIALITGLADIAGVWPVARITGTLSAFADAAVEAAVHGLIAGAVQTGELSPEDAANHGLVVLAVGKLGARDLNYSSDIDIIVLWDQEKTAALPDPNALFVRLTRRLVMVLEKRTADGYVFRTDLRLRPDPSSSPMAISMVAAETYYESVGQNWERAALIKARPIAGDLASGQEFLDRIAPFIWRKHLDYASIDDIHSIKRQIHSHKGHATIAVGGHNVKLGAGGIREIEFFAQTQQLIAGGRDPRLRVPGTCDAIRALAMTGRLGSTAAKELTDAYDFLRTLEHRLQMVADEQTHTIPTNDKAIARISGFLGYADTAAFEAAVIAHLTIVSGHYAKLFEQAKPLTLTGNLVFTGTEIDPGTLETLDGLGFSDGPRAVAIIKKWHHGHYRATQSDRARGLLTNLVPGLLDAFGRTTDSDAALLKFDEFLRGLTAGIQVFSLLLAHPELLELIAEVMGSAPALAARLSRDPGLFDAVLEVDPSESSNDFARELNQVLDRTHNFEDVLDESRRWTNAAKFRIGIRIMRGGADAEVAGSLLSNLAEGVMGALLPRVQKGFAAKHGKIPGSHFAVVAMGKLGARELTTGSDLDLVFLYDCREEADASDGPAPLTQSAYFARLGQHYISALGANTGEGRLYEVDMRLRPSGTSGPIASSLESWASYQQEKAWTFEHMALTRARVLAGPPEFSSEITAQIQSILTAPRDPTALVRDVAEMRSKIDASHSSVNPWRVKYVRGGLIDVEFIAQYLQLLHAKDAHQILTPGTTQALANLGANSALTAIEAKTLVGAAILYRNVQSFLRQCFQNDFNPDVAPLGLREALAQATGADNFNALKKQLVSTQVAVLDLFKSTISDPAKKAK
jgi:glutamate-ammonia-ligase adenylyltransferase